MHPYLRWSLQMEITDVAVLSEMLEPNECRGQEPVLRLRLQVGCGPCTTCGYVFQMKFINAVCPRCENKMTREDAFFSCGSYPDSVPPDRQ